MNFFKNFVDPVAKFPRWIMCLKLLHIADPPDVVADAVVFDVGPLEFPAADLFAEVDRFQD